MLCVCTRQLWLLTALNNCDLDIRHEPGSDLVLVDALGRSLVDTSSAHVAYKLCWDKCLTQIELSFLLDIIDFSV